MFYQKELNFLMDVFKKRHLNSIIISKLNFEDQLKLLPSDVFENLSFYQKVIPSLLEERLYRISDQYERCYYFLQLPNSDGLILSIGPFLIESIPNQRLLELGEKNGISPQKHSYLLEYYSSLNVLRDDSDLIIMLNTFCELIWKTLSFTVVDETNYLQTENLVSKSNVNEESNDALINRKTIELRYSYENELIRAVTLGQTHLEPQFKTAFSHEFFSKRADNPLRNVKNYAIIMNTLLRKGAENGGVHPLHLNQISTEFALKIEKLSFPSQISDLMGEMFRKYCKLVRKHSLQKHPLIIQKTILLIDTDLSADLSPKTIAKSLGVTLGYLSSIFTKKIGKTLSEYIVEKRIEYATYLLKTTNLQVQTIALHCGIMDAQYFSKLFKRHIGATPLQFRRKIIKKSLSK